MPKIGMEAIRRASLVEATIAEIARVGGLQVTVSQIARRAGVSSALAHHYFGSKEQIFLSAMRHILTVFGDEVRRALVEARSPRERLEAIIGACFAGSNFAPETISAWLNFYVQAQNSPAAARLLELYKRRLRSNLLHDLKPLVGARAEVVAEGVAAMIDGLYIRQSLAVSEPDAARATAITLDYLDRLLADPR